MTRRPGNVYHYAPWAHLPSMVESGALRPSNVGAAHERPMLWLFAHQHWEPTATKAWRGPDGKVKLLTFLEQVKQVGCIRFGLPAQDLRPLPWLEACTQAGMTRETRRELERAGKKRGGDPNHWFAIPHEVPLSDFTLEVFGNNAWHFADPHEMARVWNEHVAGPDPG